MEQLVATRWQNWLESVCRGADLLACYVDRVVAGGLSMGAVLALGLAQLRTEQI